MLRRTAALGALLGIGACACNRAAATSSRAAGASEPAPAPKAALSPASASASASPSESAAAPARTPASASAPTPSSPTPFGAPTAIARYSCPVVLPGGPLHRYLAVGDTRVAFVDGDDLLALVNRSPTGALPPTYIPQDLVDLRDGKPRKPSECESEHACLRREAADALRRMLDQMKAEGVPGRVESAYRGFHTQCWVFDGWATKARGGFCEAATQSALPGHSQHQLGTTVDLFTQEWADQGYKLGRGVFRNGFGCTRGGKWLDESSWRYGFVVSYPIDPDDRKDGSRCIERVDRPMPIDPKTGYKHEPWHLRYIGVDAAARYHQAWLASGPGTPAEITLEQWLRAQRGLVGDAELPVCDGCQCGACATMASDGEKTPCGGASLRLDDDGRVLAPDEPPHLLDASAKAADDGAVVVEASVHAPAHTPTQTPVTTQDGPVYVQGATFESLVPYPDTQPHRYVDLPGAWRLAVEPEPPAAVRWPWRASLAKADLVITWNRANLVLPARPGDLTVRVRVVPPAGVDKLRVTLLRDGEEHDTREVSVAR